MIWDTNIFLAEVFGTGLLILLGDGVVAGVLLARSKAQNAGWIVITAAWAFAVFVGVVVAGPISGAHLNPAVTLGLATQGALDAQAVNLAGAGSSGWALVPVYLIGEFVGAFIGAMLVTVHYWDHFKETEDPGLKLAVYSTGPNIRNLPLNFVSEVIGTFVLVFVIFAFGTNGTSDGVGLAPGGLASLGALPVALLVWSIGMSLGGTTGYAINPARDLGPRIIHAILPIPGKGDSDWGYSWVPVAGPIVGGILAALVYNGIWVNYMQM
ncbi:MAG TPA: MIP/aquaporin family protein [Candidatus Limnocylindrales bacterium]|nr:MIP/aquaporin family protein [Candidatus Limnocylindrales bacterium]